MRDINANLIIERGNVEEDECHKFSAEASELGLPIGEVPKSLPTTLGNKMPFMLISADENRFKYQQANGCLCLTIWND